MTLAVPRDAPQLPLLDTSASFHDALRMLDRSPSTSPDRSQFSSHKPLSQQQQPLSAAGNAATVVSASPLSTPPQPQPAEPFKPTKPLPRARPPIDVASHAPSPPPARLTPPPTLKSKKSFKNSLFSLFAPPNVEKARGHAGEAIPNVPPPAVRREPSTRTLKKQPTVETLPPRTALRPPPTLTSAKSAQSLRSKPKKPLDLSSTWSPPPLFQAYPQAVKHASLEAPAQEKEDSLLLKRLQRSVAADARDRSRPRPQSSGRFSRSRPVKSSISDRDQPSSADTSVDLSERKIYVLVTSGFLLQYAGHGSSDRLPERVLTLGLDSVAFASDLILGKHWVLQVQESTAPDCFSELSAQHANGSIFAKLGRRPPLVKKRSTKAMLLVFGDPDDMKNWMHTIRREIEKLGGKPARPQTGTRRSNEFDRPSRSPLSHRFVMVSKQQQQQQQPSDADVPPLSPSFFVPTSPTLVDFESVSGSTVVETPSDFSSTRSSTTRAIPDIQRLTVITDNMRRNFSLPAGGIPEAPGAEDENPTPATGTTNTSYTSAMSHPSSATTPASSKHDSGSPSYANSGHVSLSRQPSMQALTSPIEAPEEQPARRFPRVSTYNLNPLHSVASHSATVSPTNTTAEPESDSSMTPTLVRKPSLTQAFPNPPTHIARSPPTLSPQASSYFDQRRPQGATPTVRDSLGASFSPRGSAPATQTETLQAPETDRSQALERLQQRSSIRLSVSNPALRSNIGPTLNHSASTESFSTNPAYRRASGSGLIPLRTFQSSTLGSLPEEQRLKMPRNRTSFRSNSPLPLRSASPMPQVLESLTESASSTNSSPRLSLQALQNSSSAPNAHRTSQQPVDTGAAPLKRPPSMQVRADSATFLPSWQKKEGSPRTSGQQLPPTVNRNSVLVPVVRPPSVGPRARRPSVRTSMMNVPPLQGPPPARALPALPPQATPPSLTPASASPVS